jgi:hypothetical protein
VFCARKTSFPRSVHPWRRCSVDGRALGFRNGDPRIVVGGMQPTTADIESVTAAVVNCPCTSAEPGTRLNQKTSNRRIVEPARGGDAGCTAPDHHNFNIAARHRTPPAPNMVS